jgi:ACS family glucarate transporter-like MFS transporter
MWYIFSAFGWAYVIFQLPGGWLLDKFGSKKVYAFSIFFWSLFTLLVGAVGFFVGLTAVIILFSLRFLVGASEAPSFPANSRIVAAWFPANERGTAAAIFNSASTRRLSCSRRSWVGSFIPSAGIGCSLSWACSVCCSCWSGTS